MKKRLIRWLEIGLGLQAEDEWDESMRLGAILACRFCANHVQRHSGALLRMLFNLRL